MTTPNSERDVIRSRWAEIFLKCFRGIEQGIVDVLPHTHLMQPDGISVLSDEFVKRSSVDELGARDSLLLSVDEHGHKLSLPFTFRSALRGRQLFLWFRHHADPTQAGFCRLPNYSMRGNGRINQWFLCQ